MNPKRWLLETEGLRERAGSGWKWVGICHGFVSRKATKSPGRAVSGKNMPRRRKTGDLHIVSIGMAIPARYTMATGGANGGTIVASAASAGYERCNGCCFAERCPGPALVALARRSGDHCYLGNAAATPRRNAAIITSLRTSRGLVATPCGSRLSSNMGSATWVPYEPPRSWKHLRPLRPARIANRFVQISRTCQVLYGVCGMATNVCGFMVLPHFYKFSRTVSGCFYGF